MPTGGGPDGKQPIGVPKNTAIAYSTLCMQRREDLYPADTPHPHEFNPDRWQHWFPQSWQYLPFNGGPRICLGQQFALTEISECWFQSFTLNLAADILGRLHSDPHFAAIRQDRRIFFYGGSSVQNPSRNVSGRRSEDWSFESIIVRMIQARFVESGEGPEFPHVEYSSDAFLSFGVKGLCNHNSESP